MKKIKKIIFVLLYLVLLTPLYSNGMHIMEGFLDPFWAGLWSVVSLPFIVIGFSRIKKITDENPNKKLLLGLVGAFVFILSALKLPSVTGSTSHPTGIGLGAMVFGPMPMAVIGFIVLIFQALLLTHGGITTLGANVFSMGIVGPFIAYGIYIVLKDKNRSLAVFLGAALANLGTYIITSAQLALAHPDSVNGVLGSFVKFVGIFAFTQIPLAIGEGILTVIIFNMLLEYQSEGGFEIEKIG
ncbi:cobalt/nickel transport system permease protein [Acetoanaerobium pronyense]|uniref:Cobalt transport protein CbiM n=1 Tax=Acetoanaerobium pronyense TaxID=1482736 RepID=A0ABS4KIG8_9FIRM|nr:energy-coupling factor ABC transporter permease [Acetoanaerobium pronyense]MBP2027549.1 cobalt/nickel transport system permease protein [Acetoanaerobium pronyense]